MGRLNEMQKRLGVNMINARNKRDMTQHDLANKLGVSQATISQLEKGNRAPSLALLTKMEKLLGTLLDRAPWANEQ